MTAVDAKTERVEQTALAPGSTTRHQRVTNNYEHILITTGTADGVGVLTFRVGHRDSADIITKINRALKKGSDTEQS